MLNNTFVLLILFTFVQLYSQQIVKVPIQFPTPLDGYEIIDGDTIIGVFLRDSTHTRSSLRALGIKVSTGINGLMTGRVSLSDYRNINRNNSVQWITPVGISYPTLDQSGPSELLVYKHIGQETAGVRGEGDQNESDWREDYSINEGTGIVVGEIRLRSPWEGETVYIYLRDPVTPDSLEQMRYVVGLDTITSGLFLMENIPPGDYAITTAKDLVIENNVLVKRYNKYPSFEGNCLNYAISVKPDRIAKFTRILRAPGQELSLYPPIVHLTVELPSSSYTPPRKLCYLSEEDGTIEYMLLNKHNYKNLLVKRGIKNVK